MISDSSECLSSVLRTRGLPEYNRKCVTWAFSRHELHLHCQVSRTLTSTVCEVQVLGERRGLVEGHRGRDEEVAIDGNRMKGWEKEER